MATLVDNIDIVFYRLLVAIGRCFPKSSSQDSLAAGSFEHL
jgi:hypothetical protein